MHEITGTKAQCINCGAVIKFTQVETSKQCNCKDMQVVKLSKDEMRVSSGITNDNILMTDFIYI